MNMARGLDDSIDPAPEAGEDEAVTDHPLDLGSDERRMHVRAYNHWVSLLHGRPYPSIEDLDPASIADFGPNSVLLDFTGDSDNPTIRYLGQALREECGIGPSIRNIADVPGRSLLSRLTDHYLQIIANRAPIGFEAEFVGQWGFTTVYRGILMPFSSNGETIDFIYGVINWKELVDPATQAQLNAEIEESRRAGPANPVAAAIWADGPSAGLDPVAEAPAPEPRSDAPPSTLIEHLALARESAAAARLADSRSRAALYRALGRAYDFALATEAHHDIYVGLLRDYGLASQARAPMTPTVKLVFGQDYDKTRLTEFAAVLSYARRVDVPEGGLDAFLEVAEGGIKGVVKAERDHRRPARTSAIARATAELRARPSLAHLETAQVETSAKAGEFVLLLARAGDAGLEIVASIEDDAALTERAIRKAAG